MFDILQFPLVSCLLTRVKRSLGHCSTRLQALLKRNASFRAMLLHLLFANRLLKIKLNLQSHSTTKINKYASIQK